MLLLLFPIGAMMGLASLLKSRAAISWRNMCGVSLYAGGIALATGLIAQEKMGVDARLALGYAIVVVAMGNVGLKALIRSLSGMTDKKNDRNSA